MNILLENNDIVLNLDTNTRLYFNLKDDNHTDYLINFTFGLINIINAYMRKESYCSTLILPYGEAFYLSKIVFTSYKGNIFATIHQSHVMTQLQKTNIILDKDEIIKLFNKLFNIYKDQSVYEILNEKRIYYTILEIGDYILCNLE